MKPNRCPRPHAAVARALARPAAAAWLAAAATCPVMAQTTIAPGLWENTLTMKSGSGQIEAAAALMRDRIAAMPPEQRQRIEAMMAARGASGGLPAAAGLASGRPTRVQVCITPEQAARDDLPLHDGRCKATDKQRSGNTLRVQFTCSGEHPASGSAEFTLLGDKQSKGMVRVDTTVAGRPEQIQVEQSGRWLGADCGNVAPRVVR